MITGLAFLAGTIMAGEPLIGAHDSGVLPAAVGLPAYTLIGHMLIDGFVGLGVGRSLHAPLDRQLPSARYVCPTSLSGNHPQGR